MAHRVPDEPLAFLGRSDDPARANLERQIGMVLGDVAQVIRHAPAHVEIGIVLHRLQERQGGPLLALQGQAVNR